MPITPIVLVGAAPVSPDRVVDRSFNTHFGQARISGRLEEGQSQQPLSATSRTLATRPRLNGCATFDIWQARKETKP